MSKEDPSLRYKVVDGVQAIDITPAPHQTMMKEEKESENEYLSGESEEEEGDWKVEECGESGEEDAAMDGVVPTGLFISEKSTSSLPDSDDEDEEDDDDDNDNDELEPGEVRIGVPPQTPVTAQTTNRPFTKKIRLSSPTIQPIATTSKFNFSLKNHLKSPTMSPPVKKTSPSKRRKKIKSTQKLDVSVNEGMDPEMSQGNEDSEMQNMDQDSGTVPKKRKRKPKSKPVYFPCRFCSKEFLYQSTLTNHEQAVHSENLYEYDDKTDEKPSRYACSFCGKKFLHMSSMKRHEKSQHSAAMEKQSKSDSEGYRSTPKGKAKANPPETYDENPEYVDDNSYEDIKNENSYENANNGEYCCNVCHRFFASESKLKEHEVSHRNGTDLTCSICYKSFPVKSMLERHMERCRHGEQGGPSGMNEFSDKETFKCRTCFIVFDNENLLRRHESTHLNVKRKYVCKQCDEVFPSEKALKEHAEKTHKPEYICGTCDKKCSSKYDLMFHENKHEWKYLQLMPVAEIREGRMPVADYAPTENLIPNPHSYLGLAPYSLPVPKEEPARFFTPFAIKEEQADMRDEPVQPLAFDYD